MVEELLMKYDPIMCMMIDDSVKTEDASWKAWSLYIDGKFVKSFNSEMPPIKEAKEYMKENHPGKVAKLSRNTGSASGYVISSRDSKTIDHAIRSCDISMYERIYQEAKAAVGGKYGIISNLSDLETAINDANRRGEKEDAKKLKAIYKKYN